MEEWLDLPELIDTVQEMIDLGMYNDAWNKLDEYSSIYADSWEINYLYSRILTDQNKPREAIPYLHKAIKIDNTNIDCLLGLFYAFAMMNNPKKGAPFLYKAEKLSPNHEVVLAALIWYYTEINKLEMAAAYFERAKKIGSNESDTYRNGAIAYERLGYYSEAEEAFKKALAITPHDEEILDMLADHFIFLGEPSKAIDLYKKELEYSPENIHLLSRMVFCYAQENQFDTAKELALNTIKMFPNSPIGYIDIAYLLIDKGEYESAIEYASKAIDIAPLEPEGYRVKAIAYSELGDNEQAKTTFEKAISLDSENAEILRDYYHFLRNIKLFGTMEEVVQKVIKMEQPYCVEDYWFLADYFKEFDDNLNSFHYLNLAYKSTPGEKDLIPPMVDILLDQGHVAYSYLFLTSYAQRSGWNDIMNKFAMHKRLNGKWIQESMHLLRFWNQKSTDYRKYAFMRYIRNYLIAGIISLGIVGSGITYLFYGYKALIISGAILSVLIFVYYLTLKFVRDDVPFFRRFRWFFS